MKREYTKLSKAGIILKLQGNLKNFEVPLTYVFKVSEWNENKSKILLDINNFF